MAAAEHALEVTDSPAAFDREGDGGEPVASALWLGAREVLGHLGLELDDRSVILIDEASKVGLRDWRLLAELVDRWERRRRDHEIEVRMRC